MYNNKQCVGLYTRAEASWGWVMINISAKWSVAENYLCPSVELIRDGRFMTGSENVLHSIKNQSDAKLNLMETWSPAFSRASNCLLVITPGTY